MSHSPLLKIFKGPEAVEKVLIPVRHMSFVVTFLATLSGQVVLNELFGPIKDLWACFLITFPFTVGLTVLFVIIPSLDWQRVTGASVIVTLGLLTAFFWILIIMLVVTPFIPDPARVADAAVSALLGYMLFAFLALWAEPEVSLPA